LPFEVGFLAKSGSENVPPGFQFTRRRAFDEFLTVLREALPVPIDDPFRRTLGINPDLNGFGMMPSVTPSHVGPFPQVHQ
jgi:hypothetical protein